MTLAEFMASDGAEFKGPLLAAWFAGRGEWERAHEVAQDTEDRDGAWVHAHLHRQEGDFANAGYWYRRAGRPAADGPIRTEWEAIVQDLLLRA